MQRFFFLLIPILMAIMVFFFYGEAFPEKSYNRLIHEKSPYLLQHKNNPSAPAPTETLTGLSPECDYLLTATGDWGSCSTCSLHDGITFEQSGKRAVVLCTKPFEVTARNIARMMGVPDYPFTLIDPPMGRKTLNEVKNLAQDAYEQTLPNWLEG